MYTYGIVAARITGISRVRTRDGCVASGERRKSIPTGVGIGTNERTVVLASVERQSTREGEQRQDGDDNSGREDHPERC